MLIYRASKQAGLRFTVLCNDNGLPMLGDVTKDVSSVAFEIGNGFDRFTEFHVIVPLVPEKEWYQIQSEFTPRIRPEMGNYRQAHHALSLS